MVEAAGRAARSDLVVAPGTGRGNEVLAHVAARRNLRMAANVVTVESLTPLVVQRQVVGGAALERATVDSRVRLITMAGHAVEPTAAPSPGPATVSPLAITVDPKDLRAQVVRTESRETGDATGLTAARVVVGGGRGAGGPDGFGGVDALAARLGGAVGVSRVVTSLGWRPHHEQVGQTGSRIAPDLYIACGISGAIQHWAGCASSKTIIAVNTDPDAPDGDQGELRGHRRHARGAARSPRRAGLTHTYPFSKVPAQGATTAVPVPRASMASSTRGVVVCSPIRLSLPVPW